MLPWEGGGGGLEERRRLGVKTSSGCCWKKVSWQVSLEFELRIVYAAYPLLPCMMKPYSDTGNITHDQRRFYHHKK